MVLIGALSKALNTLNIYNVKAWARTCGAL